MTTAIIVACLLIIIVALYVYLMRGKRSEKNVFNIEQTTWKNNTISAEPEEDKLAGNQENLFVGYDIDTPTPVEPAKPKKKKAATKPKTVKTTTAKRATKKSD